MTHKITPQEKVRHIRLFLKELYKFSLDDPKILEDISYFFINLPTANRVTPFNRLTEDDPWILELFKTYKPSILKRLYLADWEFVKVISYQQFFVEHINMMDMYYTTYPHILWDDIIYTEMYVPRILKKFDCQKHLYLRKSKHWI